MEDNTLDPIVRLDQSKLLRHLVKQGDRILDKLDNLPQEYKQGKTSKLARYVAMYTANQRAIASVSRWVMSSDRWYFSHLDEMAKQMAVVSTIMLTNSPLGDPVLSLYRLQEFERNKDPSAPIRSLVSTLLKVPLKLPDPVNDMIADWVAKFLSGNKDKENEGGNNDRV